MEIKPDIETKINEVLESAKKIQPVEVPAFFTDKTLSKLKVSQEESYSFSSAGLLKIAAVIVLLIMNVYTIKYILNTSQQPTAANATIGDLVSEYQPNDTNVLTFEETINK